MTWVVLGSEAGVRSLLDYIAQTTQPYRIVDRPRKFVSTQVCSVVIEMGSTLVDELRAAITGVTISVQEYAHIPSND